MHWFLELDLGLVDYKDEKKKGQLKDHACAKLILKEQNGAIPLGG